MTTVLKMVASGVGVSDAFAAVQLRVVVDPNDDYAPTGEATVIINNPDNLHDFVEGATYTVNFSKTADAPATAGATDFVANSTNTRNYVTPADLKVPVPEPGLVSVSPAVAAESATTAPARPSSQTAPTKK